MTQLVETTIVGVFFPITLYAEKQLSPRNMYQGRICGMMDCILINTSQNGKTNL